MIGARGTFVWALVVISVTSFYLINFGSSRYGPLTGSLLLDPTHAEDPNASIDPQLFSRRPTEEQFMSRLAGLHAARRKHIEHQCGARRGGYRRNTSKFPSFAVDYNHHLAYCAIPKNGCSFWKRVLSILAGDKPGMAVFNLSSVRIHIKHAYTQESGNIILEDNSFKKIIIVRDPYERLFSGYIDKFFSPCSFQNLETKVISYLHANGKSRECPAGTSFTEFLWYVTNTRVSRVNVHFKPQYTQCQPCHVHYDYVGKMETILQDAEFILRSVHVDPSLVLGSNETFEENNDVSIMNDVASRTFSNCKPRSRGRCSSHYRILLRLWVTFQVRGFLSIHLKFPLSVSEAKRTTLQQFQALVKAAYRQSGDHGVVKRQRQLALQEAYHSVPRSLLAQVQRYVSEDCELFGYNCSIDSRFKVSDKPEPVFHFDEVLSPGN